MERLQLNVALKEWDVVCTALSRGQQMILLRKGGIQEAIGGFTLEHSQFLLFPTFLHQNREMLKPDWQTSVHPLEAEPASITLAAAATVTDIVRLRHRDQMNAIESEHIWTSPLIDMRFNYRPMNPLYLLIVRVVTISPITIRNTPDYAGCKSWVPLESPLSIGETTPAIDDSEFKSRREKIFAALG